VAQVRWPTYILSRHGAVIDAIKRALTVVRSSDLPAGTALADARGDGKRPCMQMECRCRRAWSNGRCLMWDVLHVSGHLGSKSPRLSRLWSRLRCLSGRDQKATEININSSISAI
jgi:hypothetical protein